MFSSFEVFEIQVILAVICSTQTNDIYTRGLWGAWQRIRGSISGTDGRLYSPQQPDRLLRPIQAPTHIYRTPEHRREAARYRN